MPPQPAFLPPAPLAPMAPPRPKPPRSPAHPRLALAARRARAPSEAPPSPADWLRAHAAPAHQRRPTPDAAELAQPLFAAAAPSRPRTASRLDQRVFYLGPVTRNKVIRALELAQLATGGTPAERHLLSANVTVAQIAADLQMDCDTLCAALLRGLVGRPPCPPALVERLVGPGVLRILEHHARVAESVALCADASFTELSFSNLRELILVGAVHEHRAISLELARAVLAARTLHAQQDPAQRTAIARRAMFLYAPLANQLGIWSLQGELEELAFMHLQPEAFHMIRHLVGERRRECESTLRHSKQFLERALAATPGVRAAVRSVLICGRVKGLYSVYRKMRRTGKTVHQIYDLLALRVVVQPKRADEEAEEAACYAIADVIKRHYHTIDSRAKDYIASPKPNGYRSLHLTVLPPEGGSTPLEIQIRTEKMHHVAEFGAAAHWIYKEHSADAAEDAFDSPLDVEAALDAHVADLAGRSTADEHEPDQHNPPAPSDDAPPTGSDKKAIISLKFTADRVRAGKPAPPRRASGATLRVHSGGLSRMSGDEIHDQLRKGYVTCLASAISASRVIVATAGQLYGLAVGSTLLDLAHGLGVASLGAIAVVNGSVAPLTQRLEMNDIVRFISTLPEA